MVKTREATGIPSGDPEYHAKYREMHRERLRKQAREYRRQSPARLVSAAKVRAKDYNRTFDLTVSDIVIPSHCPILGIPLVVGDGFLHAGSPSIDRIDSNGGYTKDNIQIISHRANSLKSDGTIEEFEAIIRSMKDAQARKKLST